MSSGAEIDCDDSCRHVLMSGPEPSIVLIGFELVTLCKPSRLAGGRGVEAPPQLAGWNPEDAYSTSATSVGPSPPSVTPSPFWLTRKLHSLGTSRLSPWLTCKPLKRIVSETPNARKTPASNVMKRATA